MNFGYTLQKIRKNRCMTQAELTQGIMKQATYSRIESGQLQVSAETLFLLVERLNISMNEFIYIHHNYSSSPRQKLINAFARMEIVLPEEVKEQLQPVQAYLNEQNDQDLLMILYAYQSLLVFSEQNDLQQVRAIASNVWKYMQMLEHWYMNDLELLNAIILFFPLETAIEVTKIAIKRLDAYDDFDKDLTYLKLYFYLNLTSLFIEAAQFEECLQLLNTVQQTFKRTLTYQTLGFIYVRKAICKFRLQQCYEDEIANVKTLMHLFDDPEVLSLLLEEVKMNITDLN
ncbi:helix-turn-helix transcriptional regulator [Metasolibacillus meyeri]|uniref:Helix-turn-helix transcriptional regulator n=1 Tax=Metasolibacillus meyeri TaxID=1071052 RepID=A0AAW9NTR4_9BACL|nr:helix-turn-helix transcriptional regulator [Metasolibacillus meyeri]MEC1177895.1 helix-turn-helix transcriptional regulator [Metasolibacillus meyeri]